MFSNHGSFAAIIFLFEEVLSELNGRQIMTIFKLALFQLCLFLPVYLWFLFDNRGILNWIGEWNIVLHFFGQSQWLLFLPSHMNVKALMGCSRSSKTMSKELSSTMWDNLNMTQGEEVDHANLVAEQFLVVLVAAFLYRIGLSWKFIFHAVQMISCICWSGGSIFWLHLLLCLSCHFWSNEIIS